MTFNIDKSPLLLKVLVLLGGGSAGLQGKGRWNHSEFKASLIYQMSSRIPGFTKTLSWKKQESALPCLKVSTSTWEVKSGWPRVQSRPGIRKLTFFFIFIHYWGGTDTQPPKRRFSLYTFMMIPEIELKLAQQVLLSIHWVLLNLDMSKPYLYHRIHVSEWSKPTIRKIISLKVMTLCMLTLKN